MIQETPEHIFFTIFSSLLQGTGIYLVLKSYICKYQKSYWFSFLFISIEILHRIFRPMATYWKLSDRIWCLEYIVYLAVFFLIVQMLLRGNLWHHLGNLFCGYLIFNLVGTTSLLGVLYLVSGFNFDAVIYTMHYGNIEHIGPVFFSGVCLKCTLCQGHLGFFLFRFLFYICLLCRGITLMPRIVCFPLLILGLSVDKLPLSNIDNIQQVTALLNPIDSVLYYSILSNQ